MSRTKRTGAVLGVAVLLVGAGYLYQRISVRRDRRRFAAPGQFISCDDHQLHIVESGYGSPAVVLESGIAASSISWSLVQPEVAKFTRVCSYDRAGLGWSDTIDQPLTLRRIVADFRAALTAAAIPRPIVLVSHSFGGLIARAYAAWYPEEIIGLVLVDPVLPAEWSIPTASQTRRLALAISLSRRGALLARFGVVRFSLVLLASGLQSIPQWIARVASGSGSSVAARLVREVQKLPQSLWPVVQSHWSDPKSFLTMAASLEALPASAAAVEAEPKPRKIPITIISAASATADQQREWDILAELGDPGKHVIAAESGHWIPFDQPELIVQAIRAMVEHQNSLTESSPASSA